MIKQKLIDERLKKKLSQEDMAHELGITQSQYSRRESGNIRISKKEWDSMAKLLGTTLEEIYEPQDGVYIINNENANGEYPGSQNHLGNFSDKLIALYETVVKDKDKQIAQLQAQLQKKDETIAYLRSKE